MEVVVNVAPTSNVQQLSGTAVLVAVAEKLSAEAQYKASLKLGRAVTSTEAVELALQAYIEGASAEMFENATLNTAYPLVFDGWVLDLPEGTIVRARANRKSPYAFATVKAGYLIDEQDNHTSGSKFAKKIAGPGRNVKQALDIKRPFDADFISAKHLFESSDVRKLRREKNHTVAVPVYYSEVLTTIDELENLGFPQDLFRDIHHRRDTLQGFRKYAKQGFANGIENPKTTSDSKNGKIYRRMRWLIDHYSGQKTDASWIDLIKKACAEIPIDED